MIVLLVLSLFLFAWLNISIQEKNKLYNYHIGPTSVSVNGHWYFLSETINCDKNIFGPTFCDRTATSILVAAGIHNIGCFLVTMMYVVSLIFPSYNFDRFNCLGLLATFLSWSVVILINNFFRDLRLGFYMMASLVIVSFAVEMHFLNISRKLKKSLLVSQLLEA